MATRAWSSVLVFAAAVWMVSGYTCRSDISLGPTRKALRKGLALDDTTMHWCASQIPTQWPNSQEPMTSIHLFKAWDPAWDQALMEATWQNLQAYLQNTNGSVLLGTQISCNEAEDALTWNWTKQLLQVLEPQSIMGLAIGNELDQLQFKGPAMVSTQCLDNIWENGYFWRQFQNMVADLDAMGFSTVPVTTVFTGLGLWGQGTIFYEVPRMARVNTFLANATRTYGTRFVFTWNFYPYYDPNFWLDAGTSNSCKGALATATCWGESCHVPQSVQQARLRMNQMTGNAGNLLWIGETGWSTPMAGSLSTNMKHCDEWSSAATFQKVYQGFLDWDLSSGEGVEPPDHVFWFALHDAQNFGDSERFGLITNCDDPACKIRSANFAVESYVLQMGPMETYCLDPPVYDDWAVDETTCQNKCTLDARCNFYSVWPPGWQDLHWCRLTATCDANASAPYAISTYRRQSAPAPTRPPAAPPTSTSTPAPGSTSSQGGVCFQALTGRAGEVATTAGQQLSYLNYNSLRDCGAACLGNAACGSFVACPDIGRVCYLQDGVVQAGDNYTVAPGGCQSYHKVDCTATAYGQVGPFSLSNVSTSKSAQAAGANVEVNQGTRPESWSPWLALLVAVVAMHS